jgi:hypothetical protein
MDNWNIQIELLENDVQNLQAELRKETLRGNVQPGDNQLTNTLDKLNKGFAFLDHLEIRLLAIIISFIVGGLAFFQIGIGILGLLCGIASFVICIAIYFSLERLATRGATAIGLNNSNHSVSDNTSQKTLLISTDINWESFGVGKYVLRFEDGCLVFQDDNTSRSCTVSIIDRVKTNYGICLVLKEIENDTNKNTPLFIPDRLLRNLDSSVRTAIRFAF